MRKISDKIYSITVTITALFAFTVWNVLSSNRVAIERIFNVSQNIFFAGEFLLGAILSYSLYIFLSKIIGYLCNHFPFVKRQLFRKMYFEGKWGGGQFYKHKNEIRLHIVTVDQDFDDYIVNDSVYSVEGKFIGDMHYESVSFDYEKRLFSSTYTAHTINREYRMEGLVRGKYSLNKHKNPDKLELYSVQSGVLEKQTMIFYKIPDEYQYSDDGTIVEYIKKMHLEILLRQLVSSELEQKENGENLFE